MKVKVSVIIPVYNRPILLRRAVKSVLAQTYQNFEIIVVDDGSSEDVTKVVHGFHDERLKYIRHLENKGAAAARNTGIRIAQGEYIAFLDADDEWFPKKLESQLQVFESGSSQLGLMYGGYIVVSKDGKMIRAFRPQCKGWVYEDLLLGKCIKTTSTIICKRVVFEKTGMFDELLPPTEDYDMWLRIARYYAVDFVKGPLAKIWISGGNISADMKARLMAKERLVKKLEPDLKTRKRAYARHHFELAVLYLHEGLWTQAKREIWTAVRAYPHPQYLLRFFAIGMGEGFYRKLTSLKRKVRW